SNGVAVFGSLTISQPGTYSLTAAGSGFTTVFTSAFNVLRQATITTVSLPDGIKSQAYNATLSSSGGLGAKTWTITAGSLPAGLVLDSGTGQISGTPTVSGTSSFTVQLSDSGFPQQTDTRALTIRIVDALVSVTPTTAVQGATVSLNIVGSGFVAGATSVS